MSQGRLLITGATGMVGALLTRRALESGYTVRVMVRATSNRDCLSGLDVEVFEADLASPETLPPALEDVDFVVNTAAHVGDWGPAEKFRAINVLALEHMLTASRSIGRLRRWVQISSLGVYEAKHHQGTDETTPADLSGLDGYTRTKAEAEVLLNRWIDELDFPATILRPGFIYGPGDRHVVPRIIERLSAGQMKLIGDGKRVLNNTYVGNLVEAILLALEKPEAAGETFNIRDERLVTREEFVGTIADYMGLPMPKRVPEWLARRAVGVIEGFAKLRGAQSAPLLTNARIKFLTLNLDFSIRKAKETLGYQPQVDFRQGMKTALQWAESEDLVPPRSEARKAG
jgi:nucleoside-diphosphate-sugar epimerase